MSYKKTKRQVTKWGKVFVNHLSAKNIASTIYIYIYIYIYNHNIRGFPDSSVGEESACNAEDSGLIPGLGRSLEKG